VSDLGKFVILSHPRSGNHFLDAVLRQHSRVFPAGEIFHRTYSTGNEPWYAARVLGGERVSLANLDVFFERVARKEGADRVGIRVFDARQHKLTDDEVAGLCLRSDIKVIMLARRNLLKAYLSRKRARLTGVWEVPVRAQADGAHCVVVGEKDDTLGCVDVEEAQRWIERTRGFLYYVKSRLEMAQKPYLKMFYEDLCLDGRTQTARLIETVFDHLGVPPLPTFAVKTRKQATPSFYESIQNRDELVRQFGYSLD